MKQNLLFSRTSGLPLRARSRSQLLPGVVAGVAMTLLLAWTHTNDSRDAINAAAIAEAHHNGFTAGLQAGHQDERDLLKPSIDQAYAAGMRDGIYTATGKPSEKVLGEACMALGMTTVVAAK